MKTRLGSPCEIPCCVRDNNTVMAWSGPSAVTVRGTTAMYEGAAFGSEEEPRSLTGEAMGLGYGDVMNCGFPVTSVCSASRMWSVVATMCT